MHNLKGKFLVLEGIDGVGKTTQGELIAKWFRDAGFTDVVTTHEPGGTPFAEEIRDLIKKPRDEHVSSMAETLLFFASREQHLNKVIRPALKRGAIVICDRFVDTTYAYQAAGSSADKVSEVFIDCLATEVIKDTYPDLTFVFEMDPHKARARGALRPGACRMEMKDEGYYIRAQKTFICLALNDKVGHPIIDADMNETQVFAQIIPHLVDIVNDIRKRPTASY